MCKVPLFDAPPLLYIIFQAWGAAMEPVSSDHVPEAWNEKGMHCFLLKLIRSQAGISIRMQMSNSSHLSAKHGSQVNARVSRRGPFARKNVPSFDPLGCQLIQTQVDLRPPYLTSRPLSSQGGGSFLIHSDSQL